MTWVVRGALFVALAFALAACVKEIPREEQTPVAVAPTATATVQPAAPTATASIPLAPTATAIVRATDTPTTAPTVTTQPEPSPTPEQTISLMLDVRGPEDGATVQTDGVVVHGFASRGAQVNVNGAPADLDENDRFSTQVILTPGDNEISITATNGSEQTSTTLNITSLVLPPQPFFLLVTQPQDQSIASSSQIPLGGRTAPGAVVSVNGVSVPVDPVGIYSTTLLLDEGPNIIDVLATSVDGEVLSTVIAVIYRP